MKSHKVVALATTLCYNTPMTEKIDEFHLAAWRAMLNAHAAIIEHIEHELAEAKQLPLPLYDVLLTLREAPDYRLRMHEIAEAVVLSRSGLTRRIDRLEALGFLARERSTTDRRGAFAVLTAEGLEALRRAWPIYARGIQEHFAKLLSDNEIIVLTKALERVSRTARRTDIEQALKDEKDQ